MTMKIEEIRKLAMRRSVEAGLAVRATAHGHTSTLYFAHAESRDDFNRRVIANEGTWEPVVPAGVLFVAVATDRPRHLGFNPVRFARWRDGVAMYRGDGPGSFRGRCSREEFDRAMVALETEHGCVLTRRVYGENKP